MLLGVNMGGKLEEPWDPVAEDEATHNKGAKDGAQTEHLDPGEKQIKPPPTPPNPVLFHHMSHCAPRPRTSLNLVSFTCNQRSPND